MSCLGELDFKEVIEMFKMNRFNLSMSKFKELFTEIDKDNSKSLSVQEFKTFILSEQHNQSIFIYIYIYILYYISIK